MELDNVEDIYPLSALQQLMLLKYLASPDSGNDVEHLQFDLSGSLSAKEIAAAWEKVSDRHAALRTEIHWKNLTKPIQVVRQQLDTVPVCESLQGEPGQSPPEAEYFRQILDKGLRLDKAPLVRLFMAQSQEGSYHVLITYHPIVLDGWSIAIVLKDFFNRLAGTDEPEAIGGRYRDYIAWLQDRDVGETEKWWKMQLQTVKGATPIRVARKPAENELGVRSFTVQRSLDKPLCDKLTAAARKSHTTLSIAVQVSWALLLGRYADRQQVVTGAVVSGRPPELPGVETIAGTFINNVPLCVEWSADDSVADLLSNVQSIMLELREHEYASPADIQSYSGLGHSSRLFESLVLFQNFPLEGTFWGNFQHFKVSGLRKEIRTDFPLNLVCVPHSPIELQLIMDSACWDEAAAHKVLDDFGMLLESCLLNPDANVQQMIEKIEQPTAGELFISETYSQPDHDTSPTLNGDGSGETSLAEICKEILGIETITPDDNLFKIGARSVQRVELHRRLCKLGHDTLTLTELFEHPSIAQLSKRLGRQDSGSDEKAGAAARERVERRNQQQAGRRGRADKLRDFRNR